MWALLALFTAASGSMPPFQMNAVCFAIGALPGILLFIVKPERLANLRQPVGAWATGIIGLFGYHFLYFTALRNAPAAEASMIAYLWPLLIGPDDNMRVLTVALGVFRSQTPQGGPDWSGLMAGALLSILPSILLFTAFGRKAVNSIQFSGYK